MPAEMRVNKILTETTAGKPIKWISAFGQY